MTEFFEFILWLSVVGWCVLVGTEAAVQELFRKEINAEVKKHLGDPLTQQVRNQKKDEEIGQLRNRFTNEKKVADRRNAEIVRLKEELAVWKEGVEKGCSAETIQEQILWKQGEQSCKSS